MLRPARYPESDMRSFVAVLSLFVEIQSQSGGDCVIRNPWLDTTVTLERNGAGAEDLSGALLRFSTSAGENPSVAFQKDAQTAKIKI